MFASVNCTDQRKKERNPWDEEYLRSFQCAEDDQKMQMFEEEPESQFCVKLKNFVPRAILLGLTLLIIYAPVYHFVVSDKYKSGPWIVVHHVLTYVLVGLVVLNVLACLIISFWENEKPKLRLRRDPNCFHTEQRREVNFYN